MSDLLIESRIHDYRVNFEDDLSFIGALIASTNRVFVIDRKVFFLYEIFFSAIDLSDVFLIDATEENKVLETVESIYRFVAQKNAKRNITLISVGGGVVQDITGFAASTIYRGIRWIFVPTTLLAQADSCIGSKTSLNFDRYKNIIGGFYPPHQIYIAPMFLDTLSDMDYASGVGEVIKFSLLEDKREKNYVDLAGRIVDLRARRSVLEMIRCSLKIKSNYIKVDEFDTGKRNLFNYGHCFGHAVENSSSYTIPHGIAVTIGMVFANIVSVGRRMLSQELFAYLNVEILLPSIPIQLDRSCFDRNVILASMENDKKRVGDFLTIIIPSGNSIDAIKVDDLTVAEFDAALVALLAALRVK